MAGQAMPGQPVMGQAVPDAGQFAVSPAMTPEMQMQQMQMQQPQQFEQMQAAQMAVQNPQTGQMPQVTQQPMEQGYQAMPEQTTQPYTTQPQMIMPEQAQAGQVATPQEAGAATAAAQKASPELPQKDAPTSTQATLLISELRDNVVIMKDGSFRAVVACKSINFDLMSEVEREGVEYSYQNFLNSLEFTTQILIRSQRVDIAPYIERLTEIRRNNDNMLLGVLMDDYINFIDVLSQEANIMDKSFFVVIPYYTSAEAEKDLQATKNFFKTFTKSKGPEITKIDRATYDKAMGELNNRVDSVISGLFQIGISSVRLTTKELAELYYNFNNPDTAVREPLGDFSKLATMYVRGEKKAGEITNG